MRSSYGWKEIDAQRKRDLVEAIARGGEMPGPSHAELDLTDRCNVDCYFCNQQDVRTRAFLTLERVREIVDELAEAGLRSVRLSGGGDPLAHKDFAEVLDHLELRGVVVDNLTTNGALLNEKIARKLVAHHAREVVFSLNAVDAADHHRMMQVRPEIFERVLENIRRLVDLRRDDLPQVVLQFLLDRENVDRLPEMVQLAVDLDVDTLVVNQVLDIPNERIDPAVLLQAGDFPQVQAAVHRALEVDLGDRLFQISFPHPGWNEWIDEQRRQKGQPAESHFPVAPSFDEANGGCFFSWYTMTIRGTGEVYPCCLLMGPDYTPQGNVREGSALAPWKGERFARLRKEMRAVLLGRGKTLFFPSRFRELRKPCVEPGACWLKNTYFRGDEEFYRELGTALEQARRKQPLLARVRSRFERGVRDIGILWRTFEFLRRVSRPLRGLVSRALRLRLTSSGSSPPA